MPIPVADILQRAATILNDYVPNDEASSFVRWTEGELIGWINEGASQIVSHRPAAGADIAPVTLIPGPIQKIPDDGVMLLDVIRNATGRAVRRVDRSLLDDSNPDWHNSKPSSVIRHFCTDDRTPKIFYVYPPAELGAVLFITYAKVPDEVYDVHDDVRLDRIYEAPLVSYVVYRALSKDSEYANGQVAAAFYQAFLAALGAQNEAQAGYSPKGALDETP